MPSDEWRVKGQEFVERSLEARSDATRHPPPATRHPPPITRYPFQLLGDASPTESGFTRVLVRCVFTVNSSNFSSPFF